MFPFAKLHPVQARGSDGASFSPVRARLCLQAGGQARGRARASRAWLPPTLCVLKGPLVRRPCLPAAAHSPVLLPHKRLICYIFSDAVNGRTKTFSLSYFCSIMFVGEPDPLQRGAEELRGSLPGLLTSQACSWACAPRASCWLLGPSAARREGSEEPPLCPVKALGSHLQRNRCQPQKQEAGGRRQD